MNKMTRIENVLPSLNDWRIIDVRSPGEYIAGHIPGALNLPLFDDEERARVGTLYKQVNPESAMQEGLKIAGTKMSDLMTSAHVLLKDTSKQNLIHCWRGGKRSEAIQWLVSFAGISCSRLEGGYKSYRIAAQSFFNEMPFELKVLGGFTGSGKTEILNEMALRGHQVIDLEKLAHHKGSAFGSFGEEEQPSNEQFENNLFAGFIPLDPSKPVWLENESKSIGRVHIPDGMWNKMKDSFLYTIDVDKEIRLDRILDYYSNPSGIEVLKESFEKIHKRLGGLEYQNAVKALNEGDLRKAASIALFYYDKAYAFQVKNWDKERLVHFEECNEISGTVERLIDFEKISI